MASEGPSSFGDPAGAACHGPRSVAVQAMALLGPCGSPRDSGRPEL